MILPRHQGTIHHPPLGWEVNGTVSILYKYIGEAFHATQRQTKSLKETSVSMILRSLAVGGCSPESLLYCCVYIMCFNIATAKGCRIMYLPRIMAPCHHGLNSCCQSLRVLMRLLAPAGCRVSVASSGNWT